MRNSEDFFPVIASVTFPELRVFYEVEVNLIRKCHIQTHERIVRGVYCPPQLFLTQTSNVSQYKRTDAPSFICLLPSSVKCVASS